MLQRGRVGRGGDKFNNFNDYLKFAQKQAGAKGNAPGFNSQFQYPDGAQTNTNWEYIDGRFDGGRAIPQLDTQRKLITGEYESMVPDIPFDRKAHKQQKLNLVAFGLGFLVVGVILLQNK